MKRVRRTKSLSRKIVGTIIAFVSVCSIIWGIALTNNMKESLIKSRIKDEQAKLEQVLLSIEKTNEVCNFAAEIVKQSARLTRYIETLHEGTDIEIGEKLALYKQEIASIEKMSNSNPYLYQVRIYVNSPIVSEKAPSLYSYERLQNMEWAKQYESGEWKLDYADTVFPEYVVEPARHLAGLIHVERDAQGEEIYLVECVTYMTSLFPDLYEESKEEWSAFLTEEGRMYYAESDASVWNEMPEKIQQQIKGEERVSHVKIDGKNVVLAYMEVPAMGGTYIHLVSLEDTFQEIYRTFGMYTLGMLGVLGIFVLVSILAVRVIMQRFYRMYGVMTGIKEGNLELKLPEEGNDEITELSRKINRMLEQIKILNKDNLDRQLLAKNAQIKSLQNQINAHFMYNVLESIKMMAEIEEKYDISDAITALGKMLRYSMKWTTGTVTVAQEIEYIRNYLNLLNLRFDYEIYLSLKIPEEIYQQEIPKMSLQPLVENAVYHGIEDMAEDTNIYIKGMLVNEKECTIEVADAGKGMDEKTLQALRDKIYADVRSTDESGHGIGLKNVQDRIQMCFGEAYGIEIYSKEGCYTKVLIRMPRS